MKKIKTNLKVVFWVLGISLFIAEMVVIASLYNQIQIYDELSKMREQEYAFAGDVSRELIEEISVRVSKRVEKTFTEADLLNENSYLGEFEFLQKAKLSKENIQSVIEEGIFLPMWGKDGLLVCYYDQYYKSNRPFCYIAYIGIGGGEYNIYGIRVGDEIEESTKILEQWGYKRADFEWAQEGTLYFRKEDVIIFLEQDVEASYIKDLGVRIAFD